MKTGTSCVGILLLGSLLFPLQALTVNADPVAAESAITMPAGQHSYHDLLQKAVLATGSPVRYNYSTDSPDINSRIKSVIRRSSYDGSRFLFEAFVKYPELLPALRQVRDDMLAMSPELLATRSTDEQLAYWLNLHNVLVIDHIAHLYPKKFLDDLYQGQQPWATQQLYRFGDEMLSLTDIKFHKVLPLAAGRTDVIYGFYEGYISGPSIRSEPFTGKKLKAQLKENAVEFVNTSRGSYPEYGTSFRASGFYQRHQAFFPNFPYDLKSHLQQYANVDEQDALAKTDVVTADINDWRIADIYGTVRRSNSRSFDAEFVMDTSKRKGELSAISNPLRLDGKQLHQLKMLRKRQQAKEGKVDIIDLPAEEKTTTAKPQQ